MAAVLDALAPYVKKLIEDMAEEEVHILLGVSGEIKKLESKTESLKYFLADAERRRITDKSVQSWVTKLKSAMYDATDILDMCQLEALKRKESKGCNMIEENISDCFRPLVFCLRNPVFAHKIGSRIKQLNQELDEIHKDAKKFNFIINLGSNQEQRKPTDADITSQRMTSHFIESAIVGEKIEKDTKKLVQELITDGNPNIKLVSIVGMGGIGKTTLAQKIFREKTIQEHFKKKIWLSITKMFDGTELIRTAIKQAGGDHGQEKDKEILMQTFTDILSKGRFLVVMDDMWSVQAWENVLREPIINASNIQPGSRVLITSRFEDLASQMLVVFFQHQVSRLDDEDAWSLLKKQISPNQLPRIDQLKDIGREILQKCEGLPLAIKVLGGVLCTKYSNERTWQDVLNHPAWSVTGLPHELDKRIYLSYEELSPQHKQCFLYCSLFPKGEIIYESEVTSMWISEGFVQTHSGTSAHADDAIGLEEVASGYYQELIKRNLIEPEDLSTRYECTMHDVVRSFAEFMAKEEMLVLVDNRQTFARGGANPIRHLCIGDTTSKEIELTNFLQHQQSLRTLILMSRISFKSAELLRHSFSFLRVLYMKHADSGSLVGFLCRLKHLRFLSIGKMDVCKLPDDINKLKFLQHIRLFDCTNFDHLPNNIIKLQNLRHLRLPLSNDSIVPKGFGGLTSLRELYYFPVHIKKNGNGCSIEEIGPLSQLRHISIHGIENVPESSWAGKAMISSKRHLRYIDLRWSSGWYMSCMDETEKQQQQQIVEETFEELCPPSCIEDVWIKGYFGRQLPNWIMSVQRTVAFKSLRILKLKDLPCCNQLPNGLWPLPSLEVLAVIDAPAIKRVGPEFQASSSSLAVDRVVTTAAFPNLSHLYLERLCEWEVWDWEEQNNDMGMGAGADVIAMPSLQILTIYNCKLRHLPTGLASSKRHALRQLNLYELMNLTYVDNFPSVVELELLDCPKLKRINSLPRLQNIRIVRCPNLEVLEGVLALDSLVLEDADMETLPEYLRAVNPRYLEFVCGKKLYESLSPGSSEWEKIKHIPNRNIGFINWEADSSECRIKNNSRVQGRQAFARPHVYRVSEEESS